MFRPIVLCTLLSLGWLALAPAPGIAQSPTELTLAKTGSMPRWTVPVLRLVSATHVEPTTGVVLSDSGMVMVPADFAGPGDEIIVLDGGTDIIRNGRPAKIIQRFAAEGVQILSVTALHRKGAASSSEPLADGGQLKLTAFPPAEMIAEGKPPVDVRVLVSVPAENGKPLVSAETPLPNVSGALVDECGNLAGYSSADGVQSMSTSASPRYLWKESLVRIMSELQLTVREKDCAAATASESEEAVPTAADQPAEEEILPEPEPPEPADQPAAQAPETEEPMADTAQTLSEELPAIEDPMQAAEEPAEQEESPEEPETADEGATPVEPEADGPGVPAWLWLPVFLLLTGGGFLVYRMWGGNGRQPAESRQPPVEAPSTTATESDDQALTPGLDSELLIHGVMADGTAIEASCSISKNAINLVIGRGNADINIESTAVSRQHASLNGSAGMLTLSDLGSSNGTAINGVPCLEGETMYINPGDTIVTGNTRFQFEIVPAADRQVQE